MPGQALGVPLPNMKLCVSSQGDKTPTPSPHTICAPGPRPDSKLHSMHPTWPKHARLWG
jgi:hypothetical protein